MEEARTSEPARFWQQIRRSVTAGSLFIDSHGVIRSAEGELGTLVGHANGALVGQSVSLLWPDDLPVPAQLEESRFYEVELRHSSGRFVPVLLSVVVEETDAGTCQRVSMMNSAELQRMNEALSHTQRLAGVGTLTASVAHELTNPLSIITATCSNLLHDVQERSINPEDLLRYIQIIEQSAFRSARIVEVLRNYAYYNGPETAVTDVDTIIRDALTLVQQQFIKQSSVDIVVQTHPELRSVVCDHNRITQVVVNLLTNARDAMQPAGGTIKINVWPFADDSGAGRFTISVHDTGHGIAPEHMPRLFEPFFTTKKAGQGTGLGLFIAKGIVDEHHGRIWAENNPDRGATFTVVLPQRQ